MIHAISADCINMRRAFSPSVVESVTSVYRNSICSLVIIFCLVLGHLISYVAEIRSALQLSPVKLFPPYFHMWTLLTYWIMERNLILLIFDLVCVHLAGKLIEPLWGVRELMKFYMLNLIATALMNCVFAVLLYVSFTDPAMFFGWVVTGFLGASAGIQMAVKQILPDSVLLNLGSLGRLKNTHLPMLNFLIQLIFALFGLTPAVSCGMYVAGMYSSWIYLRFYQSHSNGQHGDPSDHFSFASLFPSILQPVVGVASSLVFRILMRLRICRPQVRSYNLQQPNLISSASFSDAQRQRQKALRELNTRLNQTKAAEDIEWPAMDEGDGASSPTSQTSNDAPSPAPSQQQQLPQAAESKSTDEPVKIDIV